MTRPSWDQLINNCFESTCFIALATYGDEGLWSNPVYFAWDRGFNLYFISELDCVHMRNIQSSPDVVCSIFPTNQDDHVFGTYYKGTAETINKNHPDGVLADKTYYDRVYPDDPNDEKRNAPDCYRQKDSWHLVKIKPSEISYFDTRYFEETRTTVPLSELIQ